MSEIPKCSSCGRERTSGNGEHPADALDYSPMQVITGQRPLGWYSGPDGEICPEDMEAIMKSQNNE